MYKADRESMSKIPSSSNMICRKVFPTYRLPFIKTAEHPLRPIPTLEGSPESEHLRD